MRVLRTIFVNSVAFDMLYAFMAGRLLHVPAMRIAESIPRKWLGCPKSNVVFDDSIPQALTSTHLFAGLD